MFYSSIKIVCLFAAIALLFIPVQSKPKSKALGKLFDDDDVRTAIQIVCDDSDKSHKESFSNHYCNLAFAPFLLTGSYRQLQSPLPNCCDKECTLPVALACYHTTSNCMEACKDHPNCRECKTCIEHMKAPAQCCPCVAYFVGVIQRNNSAERICKHCPPPVEETHVEDWQDCEQQCPGGMNSPDNVGYQRMKARGHATKEEDETKQLYS
jgi:hypothetical protein